MNTYYIDYDDDYDGDIDGGEYDLKTAKKKAMAAIKSLPSSAKVYINSYDDSHTYYWDSFYDNWQREDY